MRRFFLFSLFFLLFLSPLWGRSAEEVALLRSGKLIADGESRGRFIFAEMAGVIEAPPSIVWEIFVRSDDWMRYGIPRLMDSRMVNEGVTVQAAQSRSTKSFYDALGQTVFPLTLFQKKGEKWVHYSFQHYNVPWPVANRWMILKTENDESRWQEGLYKARWNRSAGNIRSMEGEIVLSRFEGNPRRTLLEYQITSDPDVHVPKFLIRWGVERVMPRIMAALRREALKKAPNSSNN